MQNMMSMRRRAVAGAAVDESRARTLERRQSMEDLFTWVVIVVIVASTLRRVFRSLAEAAQRAKEDGGAPTLDERRIEEQLQKDRKSVV